MKRDQKFVLQICRSDEQLPERNAFQLELQRATMRMIVAEAHCCCLSLELFLIMIHSGHSMGLHSMNSMKAAMMCNFSEKGAIS